MGQGLTRHACTVLRTDANKRQKQLLREHFDELEAASGSDRENDGSDEEGGAAERGGGDAGSSMDEFSDDEQRQNKVLLPSPIVCLQLSNVGRCVRAAA
jgi:hypothetical protein